MDKYEYKVRSEEIRTLIAEGEYAEAVKIADTIDWRRVRSVMMLCMISDLYKINRRYQESKDILLLAYEKHPTGRLIVYSLCELSIKLGEYVQAMAYYNEFSQIAPKDTGRYILLYRLYEAQDVSLEERIAVLEEFKKRDYREKWAYELAYLYHRIGLTTKCVEECDEMFLWFGEGRYVAKALDLKALHEPLSEDQQAKYDLWMQEKDGEESEPEQDSDVIAAGTETEELALYDENTEPAGSEEPVNYVSEHTQVAGAIHHTFEEEEKPLPIEEMPTTELPEIRAVDVGKYNTINLQAELADHVMEVLSHEEEPQNLAYAEESAESVMPEREPEVTESVMPEREPEVEEPVIAEREPEVEEPVIAERKPEVEEPVIPERKPEVTEPVMPEREPEVEEPVIPKRKPEIIEPVIAEREPEITEPVMPERKPEVLTPLNASPTPFDNILSQEYDGQISLVVPEAERVEKQITGQLSIDDIMAEWEQMKKTNEQKRMEDVRKHILAQTGSLFANFDEATKNGLLEELEKAFVAAIRKEAGKPPIRQVILPEDVEEDAEKERGQVFAEKESEITVTEDTDEADSTTDTAAAEDTGYTDDAEDVDDSVEELEEIQEVSDDEETDAEEAIAEEETTEEITEEEADKTAEQSPEPSEESRPKKKAKKAKEQKAKEESEQNEEKKEQKEVREQPAATVQTRELTEEEQEIFGKFVHHRKSRQQLVTVLDNMSLASCTGNVLVTGEEEDSILALAKGLIREMQQNDGNFSGKVAKIPGSSLNKKNVEETFARLDNGALIIEKAAGLNKETAGRIAKTLEKDNKGLLLLMTDKKQKIDSLMAKNSALQNNFNLRIDVEALDDESLVEYAKLYAREQEYAIDDFGVLALHRRIDENQTSDHEVTLADVRELVDEAIYYADKKTPGHFVDVLFGKRYDEEDMIVLREKDFMHY